MPLCTICASPLAPGSSSGQCPRCLWRVSGLGEDIPPPGEAEPWLILGDHEIQGEIARGGMGIVYRARQRRLNRDVAVKVLRGGEFADAEARARFRSEAAAIGQLQHPAIVAVHDVGEEEGILWFSMDLVQGQTLEAATRLHPLPARIAAECVHRVAEAIQHAHDHGVLHRDLKPSNILLDEVGQPRVTDFGLARRLADGAAELTRTGQALGSPGYAAPEQVFGGKADVRTDVYGLGAVLYHLLTGRPPFQGPTVDNILLQLRENEPVPPRRLVSGMPRDLETICLHALRKDPAQRYPAAQAMAEDLRRFLAEEEIIARPLGYLGRGWRWARRHPSVALLLTLVAALLAVLVLGSLAFARHQTRLEHRAKLLAEARAHRSGGLANGRTRALEALRSAWAIAPSAELRNEAIACLGLHEIRLERTLPANDPEARPPDRGGSIDGRWRLDFAENILRVVDRATGTEAARFTGFQKAPLAQLDSTGQRIAIVQERGGVALHELPSGKLLQTLRHEQKVTCLDWTGELLALAGGADRLIHLWDTQTFTRLRRFGGHDSEVEVVRFRLDGQELLSLAQDSVLRVWHAARGVEILRLDRLTNHRGPGWWNAEGTKFFCVRAQDAQVDVFAVDWSRTVQVLAPGQDEPRSENIPSIGLNASGNLAAVVDETGCRVWSFDSGRLVGIIPKDRQEWMAARFGGDDSLWVSGWNQGLRCYRLRVGQTGEITIGKPEGGPRNPGPLIVATSAAGAVLALTDNASANDQDRVQVYYPASGTTVSLPQKNPFCAALSPDGRWAVTGSFSEPGAQVWSLPSGSLIKTLHHPSAVVSAMFGDQGQTLWISGGSGVQKVVVDSWHPLSSQAFPQLEGFHPSLNGPSAASYQRFEVILHRARDLSEIARLLVPTHAGVVGAASVAVSNPGTRVVLHTAPGVVVAWDLPTVWKELKEWDIGSVP